MIEATLTVTNGTGLHSRPADLFVRTAKLYESKITVEKTGKVADAKNIIKVILLNVSQNEEVTITAEGSDENDAIADLRRLIESNFAQVNEQVRI